MNELVTFSADELAGEHLAACHQHGVVGFVHHLDDGVIDDAMERGEGGESRITALMEDALGCPSGTVEGDGLGQGLGGGEGVGKVAAHFGGARIDFVDVVEQPLRHAPPVGSFIEMPALAIHGEEEGLSDSSPFLYLAAQDT